MGDKGIMNFYGKLSWRNHGKKIGTLGCNPLGWEGGTNHGNLQVVVTSYIYYLEFSYLVLGEDGSNLTRIFFEMGWKHHLVFFFSIEIEYVWKYIYSEILACCFQGECMEFLTFWTVPKKDWWNFPQVEEELDEQQRLEIPGMFVGKDVCIWLPSLMAWWLSPLKFKDWEVGRCYIVPLRWPSFQG